MRLGGRSSKIRLLIGVAIVIFGVVKYYGSREENPYTGKTQAIGMTEEQEIAIGLQNAPQMVQEYGGMYPDQKLQDFVEAVGQKLVQATVASKTGYKYDFHLLADPNTVNAFALPGGQVFITYALLSKLENEDQLAGVLGHEIGHVIGRHAAERVADISADGLQQGAAGPGEARR